MNRRNAVINLTIASGGWITLPFWMTACRISDKDAHLTSFSSAEQATLAAVTDAIIPAGAAIGALSVGVDKFLQKLIDDCYEKPVRDNVKKQLAALEAAAGTAYGKGFTACNAQQKQELVLKGLSSTDKDTKDCFALLKTETIRGFNTSQQVMEGYGHYKVAPGHYYGCVTLQAVKP
jgi:hypothetical protein